MVTEAVAKPITSNLKEAVVDSLWYGLATDGSSGADDKLLPVAGNDPDEKPSGEKRLVNAFKQPVSKLYSMFVQSVISVFDSFNTFLQAEEPLIHILYYSTLRLYRSLLSRFILPGSYPIIRWFAKY